MKKSLIIGVTTLVFSLGISSAVYANDDITASGLSSQKLQAIEAMELSGKNEELSNKMKEYYKNNPEVAKNIKIANDENDPERENVINEFLDFASKENQSYTGYSLGESTPSGTNSINYSMFEDGDIIVVAGGFCPYGYFRHNGTYDEVSGKFITAQLGQGVIYEPKERFRAKYDEAWGLTVATGFPDRDNKTRNIMTELKGYLGKPYLMSGFNDRGSFYCSKLSWVGWYNQVGINFKGSTSGFCLPDDLVNSGHTKVFTQSS